MTSLPEPVGRFVEVVTGDRRPAIETMVLETDAWMRRPKMPPIPLGIRMSHRLGEAFVHRIRIGRGPLSIPFGLDAYVDGRGLMKVGPSVQVGPTFDEAALIAMWGEALLVPSAWLDRPDVHWDALDTNRAMLVVTTGHEAVRLTVAFDRSSGLPASCEADRPKGTGPRVHWIGRWSRWHPAGPEILAPRRMDVRWADEDRPWLDLRVTSVHLNAGIDEDVAAARRALAAGLHHAGAPESFATTHRYEDQPPSR
jgi:hypothetical protein